MFNYANDIKKFHRDESWKHTRRREKSMREAKMDFIFSLLRCGLFIRFVSLMARIFSLWLFLFIGHKGPTLYTVVPISIGANKVIHCCTSEKWSYIVKYWLIQEWWEVRPFSSNRVILGRQCHVILINHNVASDFLLSHKNLVVFLHFVGSYENWLE